MMIYFEFLFCCFLRHGQLRIALDDPAIDGEMGQACDSVNAELFHEILAMFFDGFDADTEFQGNLFVKLAFGDELQHLYFTGGQLLDLLLGRGVSIMRFWIFGETRNGSFPISNGLEIATSMDGIFFHNDGFYFESSVWL